jgi:hypothetical protein
MTSPNSHTPADVPEPRDLSQWIVLVVGVMSIMNALWMGRALVHRKPLRSRDRHKNSQQT